MFRPFSRARATIFSALLGVSLASAAQAADMPNLPEPPPLAEGPVEWGSNWYLRGDLGLARTSPTDLNNVVLSSGMPNNWTIGLGGGYKFSEFFRADVTVDYQSLYDRNGFRYDAIAPCRIGLYQPDPANNPGVVNGIYSACTPTVRNRTESMLTLANAYIDLGNWWGFTPYIGAGVGVNVLYQKMSSNWYMSNGVPYAGVTYSDPRTGATYMENWDSRYEGTHLRFAYAFMGGVSYDIDNHWKVDVGYRFANLGKIAGVDSYNRPVSTDLISHQIRMGFRYVID